MIARRCGRSRGWAVAILVAILLPFADVAGVRGQEAATIVRPTGPDRLLGRLFDRPAGTGGAGGFRSRDPGNARAAVPAPPGDPTRVVRRPGASPAGPAGVAALPTPPMPPAAVRATPRVGGIDEARPDAATATPRSAPGVPVDWIARPRAQRLARPARAAGSDADAAPLPRPRPDRPRRGAEPADEPPPLPRPRRVRGGEARDTRATPASSPESAFASSEPVGQGRRISARSAAAEDRRSRAAREDGRPEVAVAVPSGRVSGIAAAVIGPRDAGDPDGPPSGTARDPAAAATAGAPRSRDDRAAAAGRAGGTRDGALPPFPVRSGNATDGRREGRAGSPAAGRAARAPGLDKPSGRDRPATTRASAGRRHAAAGGAGPFRPFAAVAGVPSAYGDPGGPAGAGAGGAGTGRSDPPRGALAAEREGPVALVRTLLGIQDDIARGVAGALDGQEMLLARIEAVFAGADPRTWADRRNARSLAVYALSGGAPSVVRSVLETGSLHASVEPVVRGALAYLEGRRDAAQRMLGALDPRSMPPSLAGPLALARSALSVQRDPREALAMLGFARVVAPGTLVEEAALRRAVFVLAELGRTAAFERLAARYVARFRRSVYAGDFRDRLRAAVTRMEYARDPDAFPRLAALLAPLEPAARHALMLAVAQSALEAGRPAVARRASAAVLAAPAPARLDRERARLYRAAARAVEPARIAAAAAELAGIDRSILPDSDRELLDASLELVERVGALPDALAPYGAAARVSDAADGASAAPRAVAGGPTQSRERAGAQETAVSPAVPSRRPVSGSRGDRSGPPPAESRVLPRERAPARAAGGGAESPEPAAGATPQAVRAASLRRTTVGGGGDAARSSDLADGRVPGAGLEARRTGEQVTDDARRSPGNAEAGVGPRPARDESTPAEPVETPGEASAVLERADALLRSIDAMLEEESR